MISSDEIIKKNFTKSLRGYDVQEVDVLLDDVIIALDEHVHERNRLLSRIEALLIELDRIDPKR